MEHECWVAEKRLYDWHDTEDAKNIVAHLSPSLIDWEKLPENERQKDHDSVHNIPQLLQRVESQHQSSGLP